ncbi:MAG TPA: sigma-70 family RNA polymerase sigma factor [Thermoanaerobaculia bacterium]|nr:sigma-70 family RNA polymerase sigma factor [Thermoanaerobaculia bacterium]
MPRVIVLGIPDNTKPPDEPAPPAFEMPPMAPEAISDPAPVPPPCVDENVFARVYEENCGLLVSLAVRKFQVPAVDAEALAHEVFVSYIRHAGEIRDLHHWLIGAICNASRYYWRKLGRNVEQLETEVAAERPDPHLRNVLNDLPDRIAIEEVLEAMPPRWAHILRLRYFEGYSIKEIAEHYNVTSKYMQKLVAKCLHRAEEIFEGTRPRKKE